MIASALELLRLLVCAAIFCALLGLVVLGAFAMYRTFLGWITGEEWLP